ncbi:MAG TPA: hemerythrin domain-containing protein [Kofleriaceae bacterium]|nr:hemerythrin domain-containing protein [Kofleriaceae bacterium]
MSTAQSDSALDPFARLERAHREIEARVAELDRAADQISDEALRADALATIAGVLAYFEGPGAIHHADEEHTLFPVLRPLEGFAQMLGAFEFQHQMNDTAFAELQAAFAAYQPGGRSRLRELAHRFAELQRAHILAEDRVLLPQAARTLTRDEVRQLGQAMARRG